eukprot:1515378-Rhodomonas_salina.2
MGSYRPSQRRQEEPREKRKRQSPEKRSPTQLDRRSLSVVSIAQSVKEDAAPVSDDDSCTGSGRGTVSYTHLRAHETEADL